MLNLFFLLFFQSRPLRGSPTPAGTGYVNALELTTCKHKELFSRKVNHYETDEKISVYLGLQFIAVSAFLLTCRPCVGLERPSSISHEIEARCRMLGNLIWVVRFRS